MKIDLEPEVGEVQRARHLHECGALEARRIVRREKRLRMLDEIIAYSDDRYTVALALVVQDIVEHGQ